MDSERLLLNPQKYALPIPQIEIVDFCQRWKIEEFYLFGSVLRDDFRENSDIDIMVEFQADAEWGFEFAKMILELEEIFQRQVDLIVKKSIEQSKNWIRKQEILSTAKLVYVKG